MPIVPGNKLGDPNYRWYNCNLEAPKIKCRLLDAASVNTFGVQDSHSGSYMFSGLKPTSKTHVFTESDIPLLRNVTLNGELVLYLQNMGSHVGNVTMSILNKDPVNTCQCTIYQRVGTMTSVDSSSNGSTGFTITVNPAAECRWHFRGF
jgi:hypothetical protein